MDDAEIAERGGDLRVVAVGLLLDVEGALLGLACGLEIAELPLDDAEIAERGGDLRVVGPVGLLFNVEGALLGLACGLEIAEQLLDVAEIAECGGDLRVVGPVGLLVDAEGALLGLACGLEIAEQLLDDAEIAERLGDLRVVGPVGLLGHLSRLLPAVEDKAVACRVHEGPVTPECPGNEVFRVHMSDVKACFDKRGLMGGAHGANVLGLGACVPVREQRIVDSPPMLLVELA